MQPAGQPEAQGPLRNNNTLVGPPGSRWVWVVTHTCVICRLSWLPRRMVIRCGYRTLSATSSVTVSTAPTRREREST